jgi:hypothetical protein
MAGEKTVGQLLARTKSADEIASECHAGRLRVAGLLEQARQAIEQASELKEQAAVDRAFDPHEEAKYACASQAHWEEALAIVLHCN